MEEVKKRRKKGWMNMRIHKIICQTHDTKTFYLTDLDEGGLVFDYIPGQYLTFRFDTLADKPIVRSYTMSSSPCQKNFSAVTIKAIPSGVVSNWFINDAKVGDTLRARGPIGKFCYLETESRPLFMVAAGSGVTPFISILREYADNLGKPNSPSSMTLLVAYRSKNDLICWQELVSLNKQKGIKIITTLTREDATKEGFLYGRPDGTMFEKQITTQDQKGVFMTCGPQGMMDLVRDHLISKGVDQDNIMTESFD